jgi:hypothetical protein
MKKYIQYGSGDLAIDGWINYDSSPTLILQRTPILGTLLKSKLNCNFDDKINYGDIVKGLPINHETVDGIFCSHVLEHLPLDDFHVALQNTYNMLKAGGRFRCIVPNLHYYIQQYIDNSILKNTKLQDSAGYIFNIGSGYCQHNSRRNLLQRIHQIFSNNSHRWMWDHTSLEIALQSHGFRGIKKFNFGECDDPFFLLPEREYQFSKNAVCLESFK